MQIPEAERDTLHRGLSNIDNAKYLHKNIIDRQLSEIRDHIRLYRNARCGD